MESIARRMLEPAADERDGYVPDVASSCGPMLDSGWVVIPYGFSDRVVRVATVGLAVVIDAMT